MPSKIDIIQNAYSQLRISGLTVNPTPEDTELALTRLESMMNEFDGRTVNVGYQFEEEPLSNTESGVIPSHRNMVETNLAIRLMPDFGKEPTAILMMQAKQSYSASSAQIARERTNQVQPSQRMPRGAGNRSFRWMRFNPPTDVIKTSSSNTLMIDGEIDDFTEDFTAWLNNEDVSSFNVSSTEGTMVTDSSETDGIVSYRVELYGSTSIVTITVVTETGRIDTRLRHFNEQS